MENSTRMYERIIGARIALEFVAERIKLKGEDRIYFEIALKKYTKDHYLLEKALINGFDNAIFKNHKMNENMKLVDFDIYFQ